VPTTPAWLAATAGQAGLAGQVNQFLGTHADAFLYAGTLQASQVTAGTVSTSTSSLYLAQEFTAGSAQTATGYIQIPLTTTTPAGSSLAPATVSLCANNAGAPGTVLQQVTVPAEYAYLASGGGTATTFVTIPLPASGLTAAASYWLTVAAAGNPTNNYAWYRSNQASGASTSVNGTAWTAQTYGFEYRVYDLTASGNLTCIWEDSGARWSAMTYSGAHIATLAEYTAGQTTAGYLASYRTLAYSGNDLTGAS
jgi:hypothetical protein